MLPSRTTSQVEILNRWPKESVKLLKRVIQQRPYQELLVLNGKRLVKMQKVLPKESKNVPVKASTI